MTRQSRVLTLLFALFQLTLPGALRVMDALSAADQRGTAAHVEETSRQGCRAAHTDDCLVCRYLSTRTAGSHQPSDFTAPTARTLPATSAVLAPDAVSHLRFRSRAPPEALI